MTQLGKKFHRGSHNFVPLVREQEDTYCSLNILFLRRDHPGKIVSGGGDLDNRLKTLMDALRVPDTAAGLPDVPEEGFDPIFCLLQDDAQITALQVVTDRILASHRAYGERERCGPYNPCSRLSRNQRGASYGASG